jgi:hypothetical protein
MADDPELGTAAEAFLKHLEQTGFFDQIKGLEQSLGGLAHQVETYGDETQRRLRELDNMAAHLLAVEALLTVVLRHLPVSEREVADEVEARTADLGDVGEAGGLVLQIARDILARAED